MRPVRVNGVRKRFKVSNMQGVHKEIARRLAMGQQNRTIAEDLGVTEVMVSYTKNSPIVADQINEFHAIRDAEAVDIIKEVQEFAPKALDLLKQVIRGDNEFINAPMTLRARTAESWLDRAGYAPVRKFAGEMLHGHFTAEEIEKLKNDARRELQAA